MNQYCVRRVLAQRPLMAGAQMQMATRKFLGPNDHIPVPHNNESTQYSDKSRHEDEPEPTEDDQISKLNESIKAV